MAELAPTQPAETRALQELALRAAHGSFFELVCAVERLFPERPQIGMTGPYDEEPVHFSQETKLAFPASDLSAVAVGSDGRVLELTTTFLSLVGSGSPLPLYLAEEVAQAEAEEPNQAALLNLFHHRLTSLLFRALADLSYPHAFQRGSDPVSETIVGLSGLLVGRSGAECAHRRLHLRYASLMSSHPGSSEALEVALADALQPELGSGSVRVDCFVGERVEIASDVQSRLGRSTRLGGEFLVGAKVLDRASKIRICVGPLSGASYQALLPGKPAFERAREVLAVMLRESVEYEFELELEGDCGFGFRLGRDPLGQMAWMGTPRAGKRVRIPAQRRQPCG